MRNINAVLNSIHFQHKNRMLAVRGRRKETSAEVNNRDDRLRRQQQQQQRLVETAFQLIRLQTIDRLYGRHAKPR